MHLSEPFLSGAPHAYFGASQGAPAEERWAMRSTLFE